MSRRSRLPATGLAFGIAFLGFAAPASAHVTVHSTEATKGGYAVIDLRVPNETDNAYTTKVAVTFTTPLASATPEQVEGWTAVVTKKKLDNPVTTDDGTVTDGVGAITWTATGKGLAPGFFQAFPIDAGPLPDTDTVAFPTLQTYSNGQTVSWIEPTPAGGAEPEHPAPVLTLQAAVAEGAAPATPVVEKKTGNGLGIAGIVVGGVGVLLAGYALRSRR